jgi:hypothetical protein
MLTWAAFVILTLECRTMECLAYRASHSLTAEHPPPFSPPPFPLPPPLPPPSPSPSARQTPCSVLSKDRLMRFQLPVATHHVCGVKLDKSLVVDFPNVLCKNVTYLQVCVVRRPSKVVRKS